MAIDPKLLVIKPVDELTEVTGLQDGSLLFYDGGSNLKRISIDTFNNLSKTAKPLDPTDPTPTIEGLYIPTVSGTYANAGGLVAQEGYYTLFFFDGTTWTKTESELPQASQNIRNFSDIPSGDFPLQNTSTEKVQVIHEDYIWQLEDGQTALSTDIPNINSLIWKSLGFKSEFTLIPGKNLFNRETSTLGAFIDSGGNIVTQPDYGYSDFIKVEPDTIYSESNTFWINFYDINKNHIAGTQTQNSTFTTPSNADYLILTFTQISSNIQVEEGNPTAYEPYKFSIQNLDVDESVNNNTTIKLINELDISTGKNLFNRETAIIGAFIDNGGNTVTQPDYGYSAPIKVEPNTVYSRTNGVWVNFFDVNGNPTQGSINTITFTSPSNADYLRFSFMLADHSLQIEKGTPTAYEEFTYVTEKLYASKIPQVLCRLSDVTARWQQGLKSPIGMFGDSTTDGAGTTGFGESHGAKDENNGVWGVIDNINLYSYPSVLQALLRKNYNNNILRVYNLGYFGNSSQSIYFKIDEILGNTYSDMAMVGISFGINDADNYDNEVTFRLTYRKDLLKLINKCYEKKIQPFFVTPQAELHTETVMGRGEKMRKVTTDVMREIAEEYSLEVLDMNAFGELIFRNANVPIKLICDDFQHFNDLGHKLESDFLFSKITENTYDMHEVRDHILSFNTQYLTSQMRKRNPNNEYQIIAMDNIDSDGFSTRIKTTKTAAQMSGDVLLLKYRVMNLTNKKFTIFSKVQDFTTTYVVKDGITTVINNAYQNMGILDFGMSIIEIWSGTGEALDAYGFKLVPIL